MAINQNETDAGANALKTYIDQMLEANGLSWEEGFIPDNVYVTGADDAIAAADGSADQSSTARIAAAASAIRNAVNSTGQGGIVSDQNCQEAASVILVAVAKVRAQANPPVKPQPAPATSDPNEPTDPAADDIEVE